MRILQVGPIPSEVGGKTQGGVATHLWALSTHLVKRGHAVGVLGDNYYSGDVAPETKEGIQIYGLMGLGRSARTAYLLCPSFWLRFIRTKNHFGPLMNWKAVLSGLLNYHRVLKEFKPDLIHIHHLEYRFPFVHYLVQQEIPIITTIHSTSFIEMSPASNASDRREFIRRNLGLAQNLIFVSQFLENRYMAIFPGIWGGKNYSVVHNPVNVSSFYPISRDEAREQLGLKSTGSVILFAGNLIPQKSPDILIEAAKLLRNQGIGFKILVVGSGPLQSELEQLVQEYGLSEQISFEGSKSQGELFLYYNAADLFVLPSALESFGLVFVEAILCGCPVIGRAEVLAEILPSEDCGYHLLSASPDQWAVTISKALARSWNRNEIHALSRVYGWEALGENYDKVYQETLK